MHEKFELARARRRFARLLKLSEEQEKALTEDPRPFLERAYAELWQAQQTLREIRAAASGTDQMLTPPPPGPPRFVSIQEELNQRLQRVQRILREYPE